MSDPVTVRFEATPDLMRAAIAQSNPDTRRRFLGSTGGEWVLVIAVIALLIALTFVATWLGRVPLMIYAGYLFGLLVSIGVFLLVFRKRVLGQMDQLVERMAAQYGTIELTFGPDRIVQKSDHAEYRFPWRSVTGIGRCPGGSSITLGDMVMIIEDEQLPAGLTADAFRARLEGWRAGA